MYVICMHVFLCIYVYVQPIVKIMVSCHNFPLVETFETIGNLFLIKVYCLWSMECGLGLGLMGVLVV